MIILLKTKQKLQYDAKHSKVKIFKGAIVLMRDMRRKKRKGGKLDPKWLRPYTIIQQLGKGFYSPCNSNIIG